MSFSKWFVITLICTCLPGCGPKAQHFREGRSQGDQVQVWRWRAGLADSAARVEYISPKGKVTKLYEDAEDRNPGPTLVAWNDGGAAVLVCDGYTFPILVGFDSATGKPLDARIARTDLGREIAARYPELWDKTKDAIEWYCASDAIASRFRSRNR